MKTKIIASFLSVILLAAVASSFANGLILQESTSIHKSKSIIKKGKTAEAPVISFAVISDVHFGNNQGSGPMVKVPQALKSLMSKTPIVDALFVVGDLTDGGTATQYDQFISVFNNTENIPASVQKIYMMGNHDNYPSGAQNTYLTKLGQPLDQYHVINGIPFITVSQRAGSNSGDGLTSYPEASINFLTQKMAEAATNYPGKPIFVFTHVAPLGTCYGARRGDYGANNGWGMPILMPILKQYPQAVVFSGHSHFPIGNPHSINQDSLFTSINTGSTTYSEVEGGLVNAGIHPEQYENVTEGYIVSVMANGDVKLNRWDTYRNEEILPAWTVKAPHDGSQFTYMHNRPGKTKPYFTSGSTMTVTPQSYYCSVSFPQAKDDDTDDVVQYYSVEVLKGSTKVSSFKKFSQYYLNSAMPQSLSVASLSGLQPNTSYVLRVTAFDSYNNASLPLETSFQTPSDNDPNNQPPARVGSWLFDNAADMFKASIGANLIPGTTGTNTVTFPAPNNANIVSVTGPVAGNRAIRIPKNSCVKMIHNLAASGGAKVNEYTLMIDFKVDLADAYYPLLQTSLANNKDADIFIKKDGSIGLSATNGGYSPMGAVSANTWSRYVLVVKAGKPWKEFLNGALIYTASGNTPLDDRWSLDIAGSILFGDNNSEDAPIEVAEIALWDKELTIPQISNLGLFAPTPLPESTSVWKFDNPSEIFKATKGTDLTPAFCAGSKVITYPETGNANIVSTTGPTASNKAISIPKGSCVKMIHGIAANGGGCKVNEFSLMIDFKVPLTDNFYPLLQSNLQNSDDGDFFIRKDGSVGLTGPGYSPAGSIKANTWSRLVIVVEANNPWRLYLDGSLLYTGSSNVAVDSRYTLDVLGSLLFADESNEDGLFDIAEIAIWNTALNGMQVAELGAIELNDPATDVKSHFTIRNQLKAYPNPYKQGQFTIETELSMNDVDVIIMDINGRQHFTKKTSFVGGKLTIQPGNLLSGIYFLIVADAKNRLSKEIIVEKYF